MEYYSCVATVAVLVVLLCQGAVCGVAYEMDDSQHYSLLKRMDKIQQQLAEAASSMQTADANVKSALFNCLGIHNSLCEAKELEAALKAREQLESHWGPGKRASLLDSEAGPNRKVYREISASGSVLKPNKALKQLNNKRKRDCNFNLGFHCDTEEIFKFADLYDFLSSPLSPGKK